MGLLLGLGLLGAAFGIDAVKQAPFDRAYRRLENEWGTCTSEENKRCDALKYAVQNGLCFEDEKKPVIEWQKLIFNGSISWLAYLGRENPRFEMCVVWQLVTVGLSTKGICETR